MLNVTKKYLQLFVIFAASLFISFVLYSNSIGGEFVFDDVYFIGRPELRTFDYIFRIWFEPMVNIDHRAIAEIYRPFTMSTFMLNFILFGDYYHSFHIVNIIFNGLAIFLSYAVVRMAFKNQLLAIFASLLFAFLPIHTEVVAYIKAREEILAMIFMLLAWITFMQGTKQEKTNWLYVVFSSFLFFLGGLSKEFSVLFPVVIFAHYIWTKKPGFSKVLQLAIPFVVFVTLFLFMWHYSLGGKFPFQNLHSEATNPIAYVNFPERIYTAFAILSNYVTKIFVPVGLSATYRYNHFPIARTIVDARALLGVLMGVLIILPFFLHKKKYYPLMMGSLIFIVCYFPYSKFIFTGGEYIAERWVYFASLGLCIIAGWILMYAYRYQKYIIVIGLIILCFVYGVMIYQRNRIWLTPKSLYKSMTIDAPNSVAGYTWLSRYYLLHNNYAEAEKNIIKALEIFPEHNQVMAAYAAILVKKKLYIEAENAILKSIEYKPEVSTYYYYAFILTKLKEYEKSQEILENTLSGISAKSQVRFLSAVNLYKLGKEQEARKYFNWNPKLTDEEKIRAIEEF